MAVIIIAIAFAAVLKVGMMASKPLVITMTPPASVSTMPQVAPPGPVEQVRVVEVPVIREKIRTVYVAVRPGQMQANQVATRDSFPNDRDLAMTGSIGVNGYFTRANLSGFAPSSEMKTRVISEVKENEK